MSWNLHFEMSWRPGGPVPVEIRKAYRRVLGRVFKSASSLGLVVLEPSDDAPLRGFVQILFSDRSKRDFEELFSTLKRIARDEPRLLVTATDEFELTGEDVLAIDAAPGPKPIHGAGAEGSLAHHAVPRLEGWAVATSFLDRLSAKELITWCGPREAVIQKLSVLVDAIERGRWRGAGDVSRILEDDPSVDELFATDQQLDELWRLVVNR